MRLQKRGLRNCFILGARPSNPGQCRFAAQACTLRFIPMRAELSGVEVLGNPEYPPRKAIEDISPGMAPVIDARGVLGAGVIGYILVAWLQERSVTAAVRDGPVRDAFEVTAGSPPVFCAGSTGPASLNVHFGANLQRPIDCGGVAVIPGDVLVGDGVVVSPAAPAEEVVCDGGEQERLETFLKKRVAGSYPTIGTYPPNPETLQAYEV